MRLPSLARWKPTTYIGGKRRNIAKAKRKVLTGRGSVGKTAVAGIKDRASNRVQAKVDPNAKSATMSRFIMEYFRPGTKIYTNEALAYKSPPNQDAVWDGSIEYARGQAHTNGIESFRPPLKRAHQGVFQKISPKHLDRYVRKFSWKHNLRKFDTLNQMRLLVVNLAGKRLTYRDLTADNGLPSGARSEGL